MRPRLVLLCSRVQTTVRAATRAVQPAKAFHPHHAAQLPVWTRPHNRSLHHPAARLTLLKAHSLPRSSASRSLHDGVPGSSDIRNADLGKQAGNSQEAARHAETQKQGTPVDTEAATPAEASTSASGPGSILSAESSPEAAAGSPLRKALGQHGDATSAEIAKTQRAAEAEHTAAAAAAQAAAGAAVGAAAGAVAGAAAGAPSTGAAAGAAVGAATPGVFSAAKQAAYDFLGFEPGADTANGSASTQGEQVSA